MNATDIDNPLFRQAVEAIDAGDLITLRKILDENPALLQQRLEAPNGGYFKDPHLIWFIAYNPIREKKVPNNIVEVLQTLLHYFQKDRPESYQEQLDYTLALVATGSSLQEAGYQLAMLDLLIDAGAFVGDCLPLIAHGGLEAAEHLLKRGSQLTLPVAVGLDRRGDVVELVQDANELEKYIALLVAAFLGNEELLNYFIQQNVDVNTFPATIPGFHSHATALHQAVSSGSLSCVKLLVNAGANLNEEDRVFNGTPRQWARHMQNENTGLQQERYAQIASYLESLP